MAPQYTKMPECRAILAKHPNPYSCREMNLKGSWRCGPLWPSRHITRPERNNYNIYYYKLITNFYFLL